MPSQLVQTPSSNAPSMVVHSNSPEQSPPKVNPASVEYRSDALARIAARSHEIPEPTASFLSNPAVVRSNHYSPDPLCDLVLALIRSSEVNESSSNPLTQQREANIGMGFATSLRWLHRFQLTFEESIVQRLILKSLIPMYLAAGQGRVGSSIAESVLLMRNACALFELDRITSNNDLAEWLRNTNPQHDPVASVPKSFRVCLDLMSKSFWSEVSKGLGNNLTSLKPLDSKNSASKHNAWWSLAFQLSEHKSQITVPAEVSVGVVAWDKLLDHWSQVLDALSGAPTKAARLNPKPMPTESKKPFHAATSIKNSLAQTKTPQESNVAADTLPAKNQTTIETKFDFANDLRFVEIRSAKDPHLSSILDQLLLQCRNDQGQLSLIVVKKLDQQSGSQSNLLQNWQSKFIHFMDERGESANVRGFISDDGELSLVFQDVERSELAQWVRDSFARFSQTENSQLATPSVQPLVAGVATVNAPSRLFKIEQLIQAAWRCLDGASNQGAGAVKTIEVY